MEFEIKLRIEDPQRIEETLLKLGGEFMGTRVEIDTYFNFDCNGGCCRNFAETDEAIRLRLRDSKCILTYKGPRISKEVKAREEIEVEVGDCNAITKILEKMCLKPVAQVKKKRRYWKLGNATITIDYVEELGTFMEIEVVGEDASEARSIIDDLRRRIAPSSEVVEETYLEMLLKKRGISL
ncbi:adenylyl cyclase CyaB [Ignicoccus pacificus DSM 13166]|uniref:Adenylyl cyclase CyaB n=1 Tax=Ignicoccus pacificus DSM 13166 TaxID=940294 RepID=A0A977K9H4_9CREN|nr:adenylyl cyclase CyaB [Ignicoccus pacificus DSM 13166]